MFDAVILSDIHLGSESCQAEALQDFIHALPPTQRLILNGDVLQDMEHRLTKQHWRVLSLLRKRADQLQLIWVRGNHDYGAEPVAHLVVAEFVPEYAFESGIRRVLCVHGDTWDRFITDHPIITNVADWFYLRMQRWSRRLAHRTKQGSKTFLRCVDRVRTEAIEYGKAKGADAVICGHAHFPEAPEQAWSAACDYYNAGSWTDHRCNYLTVQDGWIELREAGVDESLPALPAAEAMV